MFLTYAFYAIDAFHKNKYTMFIKERTIMDFENHSRNYRKPSWFPQGSYHSNASILSNSLQQSD